MKPNKINVLLVDDHELVRDGIKSLLHGNSNISIEGEANNGLDAIDKIKNNKYDIILMDINMPKMDGISATKEISKDKKAPPILALSMHNQESYIAKILEAGASGYLLKDCSENKLIEGIHKVAKGDTYFTAEVAKIMMQGYMTKQPNQQAKRNVIIHDLTKRETEILKLITNGFTNQEIAQKLFISRRTVDTHRRNLIQKIGARNTAELVKEAIFSGILDDNDLQKISPEV